MIFHDLWCVAMVLTNHLKMILSAALGAVLLSIENGLTQVVHGLIGSHVDVSISISFFVAIRPRCYSKFQLAMNKIFNGNGDNNLSVGERYTNAVYNRNDKDRDSTILEIKDSVYVCFSFNDCELLFSVRMHENVFLFVASV